MRMTLSFVLSRSDMCCPEIKHFSDTCCKLQTESDEKTYKIVALEETIRVLQAEIQRLSNELARTYE